MYQIQIKLEYHCIFKMLRFFFFCINRESELPLSASNLAPRSDVPDTNPVHRVFVTKKPSLRRDSHPEMKSFGDRRSNPNTSDSDRGSPVNRRYGSYPSSPVAPVRDYQFEQKMLFLYSRPDTRSVLSERLNKK